MINLSVLSHFYPGIYRWIRKGDELLYTARSLVTVRVTSAKMSTDWNFNRCPIKRTPADSIHLTEPELLLRRIFKRQFTGRRESTDFYRNRTLRNYAKHVYLTSNVLRPSLSSLPLPFTCSSQLEEGQKRGAGWKKERKKTGWSKE